MAEQLSPVEAAIAFAIKEAARLKQERAGAHVDSPPNQRGGSGTNAGSKRPGRGRSRDTRYRPT